MQQRNFFIASPSLALEYFEEDTEAVVISSCCQNSLYHIMSPTSNRKRVGIHTKCLKSCVTQLLDFSGRERELLLVPHSSELMSVAVHVSITQYWPQFS